MRIAVTGCSGFLGKKLVEKLLTISDIKVVAFTSKVEELLNHFYDANLEIYRRNDFYGNQLESVDVLINCAFPRNEDGEEMAKGLAYISNIFNVAKSKNVKSVINISSQSVYSQKRKCAANEKYHLCLESIYAVGKYTSELLTNTIFQGIQHTNLRLASLIGIEFEQRVVNKLIDKALQSGALSVSKDHMNFGFMDVDDAVDAIVKVVENRNMQWDEVYNIGIDGSYSLINIAKIIKKELDSNSINVAINILDGQNELNTSLDSTRFNETFSFLCKYTMEDTVKKIIEFKLKKGF